MSTLNETRSIVNSELLSMLKDAYAEGFHTGVEESDSDEGDASFNGATKSWVESKTLSNFMNPEHQEQLREG